jgi:UDP-N-acetylglucosamine--N-acetylmuramyl-(pentapeptide) pyrophosphoryl-undecaprenol N-acetylglucosamine transferase
MRTVLAGGGTGGHLIPGMALASAILGNGGAVLFITAGRPVEARILGDFPSKALPLERGGGAPGRIRTVLRLPAAYGEARSLLREFSPDVVLGLGGLASFPVVLAAANRGIPRAVLEINAVPGRATRWLRPFADAVFVANEEAKNRVGRKAILTGAPIRASFEAGPSRESARAALGLDPKAPTLVVLGGSQGAAAVNRAAAECLEGLECRGGQLIWVAGPGKDDEARAACAARPQLRSVVFGYVDDAAPLYAAADAALCRGGASTVAELAASGLPSVVIPYPHHRDKQQTWNARQLGAGALIVEEDARTSDRARAALFSILDDGDRRLQMARACRSAARPGAAAEVARALDALIRSRPQP